MENHKSVQNLKKISTSDLIISQINKAVSKIEFKQITNFKECIDGLFELKNGF